MKCIYVLVGALALFSTSSIAQEGMDKGGGIPQPGGGTSGGRVGPYAQCKLIKGGHWDYPLGPPSYQGCAGPSSATKGSARSLCKPTRKKVWVPDETYVCPR
jgi:hypothetical protein